MSCYIQQHSVNVTYTSTLGTCMQLVRQYCHLQKPGLQTKAEAKTFPLHSSIELVKIRYQRERANTNYKNTIVANLKAASGMWNL